VGSNVTVRRLFPRRLKDRLRDANVPFPVLLEPIDYMARLINGKEDLPPLRLRKVSGPLSSFETSSVSFLAFLSAISEIQPTHQVLDIGCGCGAIALQLREFFAEKGGYTGVDIHGASISWCRRHLTPKDPKLRFKKLDVRNDQYNREGRQSATDYVFPFPNRSFDIILVKSVFTHMRPEEVDNYLKEIGRLLVDHGHCLMTFFLLTPQREELISRGMSPTFAHDRGVWRYDDERLPERAIAYDEGYVRSVLSKHGLALARPILYAHQDVLLTTPVPISVSDSPP
jgi:SAM-dependent methyltransferase